MSHNEGWALSKSSSPDHEVGQQDFEGLLRGPLVRGPGPFIRGGLKGLSREGLQPRTVNTSTELPWDTVKDKSVLGMSEVPQNERTEMT